MYFGKAGDLLEWR